MKSGTEQVLQDIQTLDREDKELALAMIEEELLEDQEEKDSK